MEESAEAAPDMGLSWPAAQEDVPTTLGLLVGAGWSLSGAVRDSYYHSFHHRPVAAADYFNILLSAGSRTDVVCQSPLLLLQSAPFHG